MERLKFWLFVILLLLIIVISVGFSLWNTQSVPLSFGVLSLDPRPVSFWVVASFAIGGLCGLLLGAGFLRNYKLKRRIRRLEKALAKCQQGNADRSVIKDEVS